MKIVSIFHINDSITIRNFRVTQINLNKAIFIKPKLIEILLKKYPNYLWGNEIRFGSENSFADLIAITHTSVIAYEIKSRNDKINGIEKQLRKYFHVFDLVYLVVTENHLTKALQIKNKSVGVILMQNDGTMKLIRKAVRYKNQSKKEIIHSITLKFLQNCSWVKKYDSKKGIRTNMLKLRRGQIKSIYLDYLVLKLKERNRIFLNELGANIHIEDLSILSSNKAGRIS